MNFLVNGFLFFSLLPFISPMPVASDVQLPAFVFGAAIILLDILRGRFRIDWIDLAFVMMAVWSFAYVLPGGEFVLRQRVGLSLAFIIFYVAKRHAPLFSPRVVYAAIVVNFASVMVQWLLPGVFQRIVPLVVRTLKAQEYGRGFGGLSAEPSFLAAMAVVQGLLLFYFYKLGRVRGRRLVIGWALAFATLMLSRSATGFAYLMIACVIYFGYFFFRGLRPSTWLAFVTLGIAALALIVGPLATTRGGAVVVALYENPAQVVSDGAMQERVSSLTVGILAVPHHLLGVGGGRYEQVAWELDSIYHFDEMFPQANRAVFGGVLSSVGLYLAECGLIFVFFLGLIFWRSSRLEGFHLLFCTLAFLFILVTFSITFPLTWLLLGMAARRDFLRLPQPVRVARRPRPRLRPRLA